MAGPFKMRSGNSPLKETEDWFNVRSYLKGEQGLIPDWKGESTSKTATKVSQAIQKGHSKVKKGIKKSVQSLKNFSFHKNRIKKIQMVGQKAENILSIPRSRGIVKKIPTKGLEKLHVKDSTLKRPPRNWRNQ